MPLWALPGEDLKGCVWLCCLKLWLLPRLLCLPGEKKHVCSSYGSSSLLQLLSSHLAYPGLNQQCRQCKKQDNWHCEQDQQYSTIPESKRGLSSSIHRTVNIWQDVCLIQYMIMWGPMRPKTEVALTASPGLDLLSTDRAVGKFCFCVFNMQNCTLLFPIHLASSLLTTRAWLPLCIIAILVQAPHLRLFTRQPS